MYRQIIPSNKKRGRIADDDAAAPSTAPVISQQQPQKKESGKSKEDFLSSLGLLPPVSKIRVKPCDPTAGLTLGGVPVTQERLANLNPMDLDEHVLMRNGEPLPISELAELLGMDDIVDDNDFDLGDGLGDGGDEDDLILGLIEIGMLDLFVENNE